jgi:hypothetical protein
MAETPLAVAFRNLEQPEFIFIRLPETYAAPDGTTLAILNDAGQHDLKGAFIETNLYAARNPDYYLENLVLSTGFSDMLLLQKSSGAEEYAYLDKIAFHHSFFSEFFEIAKGRDIYLFQGEYVKPAPLAVLARCSAVHASATLKLWISYYSRLLAPEHLYLLVETADDAVAAKAFPGINVVPLAAAGPERVAEAVNGFQRFLLSHYNWVMQTSCDEIILHKDGIDAFLTKLPARNDATILRPGRSFLLDAQALARLPTDDSGPEMALSAADVPVLSSIPITWHPGFTGVREQPLIVAEPNLWRVRLIAAQDASTAGDA